MYAGHLDFSQKLLWTIEGVLSEEECASFMTRMRASPEAEVAPIIGREGEVIDLKVRSNTRVMFDDPHLAKTLWERIRAQVPERLMGREVLGVNERIRLYRYAPGQRHGSHWDTPVELPDGRQTLLTFVVYLNHDFRGGGTSFSELGQVISPSQGRALLFQHRILHQADEILSGEKFVLRSDIFYR